MLTLTPNVFRKDFQNIGELNQKFGASLALNCLSKLCNEELAQLLYMEILPLFNCSQPYLRKKTCILSYKLVLHCPESTVKLVPYLADRLQDPDLSRRMDNVHQHIILLRFVTPIPAPIAFKNAEASWVFVSAAVCISPSRHRGD